MSIETSGKDDNNTISKSDKDAKSIFTKTQPDIEQKLTALKTEFEKRKAAITITENSSTIEIECFLRLYRIKNTLAETLETGAKCELSVKQKRKI